MLYPVQKLIRVEVPLSSYYEFILENQVNVPHVIDPHFLFVNTTATAAKLRIIMTIAVSGSFSDAFTVVNDVLVPIGSTLPYVPGVPIIRDGIRQHTVRFINNDGVNRYLYAVLSGWADIKTVLSANIISS